jgi:hypothetical protein
MKLPKRPIRFEGLKYNRMRTHTIINVEMKKGSPIPKPGSVIRFDGEINGQKVSGDFFVSLIEGRNVTLERYDTDKTI